MYMKLKDGKSKVLTFSYDDGVVQDIRLIDIFNRHGLKATFNINSGLYLREDAVREKFRGRLKRSEALALYCGSGHEVAVHGVAHGFLSKMKTTEMIKEVLWDRERIEEDYGTLTRGMAYAYGDFNDEVIKVLDTCGIAYSRTVNSTLGFGFPQNWLALNPTCHHNNAKLMTLAEQFVTTKSRYPSQNWLFYVWGHSYEFDDNDNWDVIERFAEYVGGKEDIWYATNIEIYDYVKAYESLLVSANGKMVHNPTATDVWFMHSGETYCAQAGTTLRI
jgi:peptidoglycan/xylan/chitin deacetylase (PgdA/CDA1 family)